MERRQLIFERSAAVVVWIAAFAHAATIISERSTRWLVWTRAASDPSSWAMAAGVIVVELVVPICLVGWLGTVVWITGDIGVRAFRRWEEGSVH